MAVFRVNKTNGYTVMSNFHLKDKRLSLKAKGLLSLILSLPDEWIYTIGGLVAICIEKEVAVKTALNELKRNGYLRIDKIKPCKENGGRYEYIYNIFEQPIEIQGVEKQGVEIQPLEIQPLENIPLYKDTKESITDLSITNTSSIDNKLPTKSPRHKYGAYNNVLLSDEDMEKLKVEFPYDYEERIERLSEYIASKGAKYKSHLATIRAWSRRDKPKKEQKTGNVFLDLVQDGVYDD